MFFSKLEHPAIKAVVVLLVIVALSILIAPIAFWLGREFPNAYIWLSILLGLIVVTEFIATRRRIRLAISHNVIPWVRFSGFVVAVAALSSFVGFRSR